MTEINVKQVREEIIEQNLDLHGISELLEKYGSNEDPIFYRGDETTPSELAYHLGYNGPHDVLNIRISFYGSRDGKLVLRKNSNFAHMVKDRMDLYAERDKVTKKKDKKLEVEYIVSWRDKTDFASRSKTFTNKAKARKHYTSMKERHDRVTFRKVTNELLQESDD